MNQSPPDSAPLVAKLESMSDRGKLRFLDLALAKLDPSNPTDRPTDNSPEFRDLLSTLDGFNRTERLCLLDRTLSTLPRDFSRGTGTPVRSELRRTIYRSVPRHEPSTPDEGDISAEIHAVCEAFRRDPTTLDAQPLIRSESLEA